MRICGSTDIMKCAAPSCQTEEDNETLLCAKCKKEFHYQCTNLPAYQIFKFTQIEYSLYECEGCVVIPTHMQEMVNSRIHQNKCDRRFAEIDSLKSRLRQQENVISELKEHAITLETTASSPNKKRRYGSIGEQINVVLIEESANKGIEIQALQNEIALMKEKSGNKNQMIEKSTEMTQVEDARKSEKLSESEWRNDTETDTQSAYVLKKLGTLIDSRMNQIEQKFLNLEQKMEKNLINAEKEVKLSYSNAVSKKVSTSTISNAIQESKNTERVIEAERAKREKNFIIHGVSEEGGESDTKYTESLFQILGVSVKPVLVTRLGKMPEIRDESINGKIRHRPIKVTMSSIEHKELVIARLVNLKNADDKYRKISVKYDYTIEERNLARQWLEKAQELNKNENTNVHVVRGNPKNGFRLAKIARTSQNKSQMEESSNTKLNH